MAWAFNSAGKNETSGSPRNLNVDHGWTVAVETQTLGGSKLRYSSVIDWIPPGAPFTIITNTAATNTSGSISDQLYACETRAGTYRLIKDTLRDCNYADDNDTAVRGGTSYRDLDTNTRVRHIDPEYVGAYPYWKIATLAAAVESTNFTIREVIMFQNPGEPILNKQPGTWRQKNSV